PGAPDFGTGGGAENTFPGADVPFGMVQWSPDTVVNQPGGYFYPDNRIRGFSMTHFSGAGCNAAEDLPFMPFVGQVTTSPASDPMRYVSTFSHSHEAAAPGYYGAVSGGSTSVRSGAVASKVTAPAKPRASATRHPATAAGAAKAAAPIVSVSGPGSGAFVTFDSSNNRTVNVRVGLSYVSVANATANAKAEQGKKNFDAVAKAARAAWNARLGEVDVTGGTPAQR